MNAGDAPIVALAGRRIDAPAAPAPRFPPDREAAVRGRLDEFLRERGVRALVSSAACGADLLALELAGALGLRRRVILPFAPDRFRSTSVTDRPGDWGPRFDTLVRELPAADLVILNLDDGDAAYAAVNDAILDEATSLAANRDVIALLVWEGQPRGDGDLTAAFGEAARAREIPVEEILTL